MIEERERFEELAEAALDGGFAEENIYLALDDDDRFWVHVRRDSRFAEMWITTEALDDSVGAAARAVRSLDAKLGESDAAWGPLMSDDQRPRCENCEHPAPSTPNERTEGR